MKKIKEQVEYLLNNYDIKDRLSLQGEGAELFVDDLLALIPKPRTEEEILKDFEKMGYKTIIVGDELWVMKELSSISKKIIINKDFQSYECEIMNLKMNIATLGSITIQEHKLLNELFECWGWI